MKDGHPDHQDGTQLRPDQAAFIVNPDGSFQLALPKLAEGQEYTRDQLFVLALAMKIEVPGWFDDVLEEFLQFCTDNRDAIEAVPGAH